MFDELISRSTLRAAFERVRENGGCRGADGVTVQQFAADLDARLDHLQSSLIRGCYRPFPLLRFPIPKPAGGVRYLTVPTVRDRVAQTAADLVAREVFEAQFEDSSHAFRCGRGVRTAVARIDFLRSQGYGWVLDADVDGFFETIPHAPLRDRVAALGLDPRVTALFEAWIAAEEYDGRTVRRRTCGLPQGSVVSPLLANLFLDELDEELARHGRAAVRYADDFLVLCTSPADAAEALELTDDLLAGLELSLNREKTRIASFDQGFQFLGAVFLRDTVFLPYRRPKKERTPPSLPPPLDLLAYLELRAAP